MAIKRAIKAGDKSIISFKKAIKVGEITQLLDKNKFRNTFTSENLTLTNNGNGSVTVTGTVVKNTAAKLIYQILNLKELIKGHKYLLSGCPKSADNNFLTLNVYNDNNEFLKMWYDYGDGVIFTFDQEYYCRYIGGVYIYEREVGAEVNRTFTPQLFDLTEMFGAGHEPATVAEFKAKFPEAYYPYQRAVLTVYNKVVRPCARKGEVVQLVDPTVFNKTREVNGITYTGNNGVASASGTAVDSFSLFDLKTSFSDIFPDHIYLITGCPEGGSLQTYNLRYSTYGFGDIGNGVITSGKNINNFRIAIKQGTTVENLIFTPQLFDLTAMYGAGNEPKTLADFRKDFPESYYPYNPIQTKNLWTCNKTSSSYFKYDKATQIYTITRFGSESCYKLPSAIPAGETFTISVKCLSGEIQNDCAVVLGGYHNVSGDTTSWEVFVKLPQGEDVTGRTFTATGVTTHTLTDFWIFVNYPVIPKNLRFMVQFEKGAVATDYVPHDYI